MLTINSSCGNIAIRIVFFKEDVHLSLRFNRSIEFHCGGERGIFCVEVHHEGEALPGVDVRAGQGFEFVFLDGAVFVEHAFADAAGGGVVAE